MEQPQLVEQPTVAPSRAPQASTPGAAENVIKKEVAAVGEQRHSHSLTLHARVERVLHDLSAGRTIADDELLQHRADCRFLMEQAADRWMDGRESREVVDLWMHRFMAACEALSPAWKAAREAQIQQSIAEGIGFFVTQGDRAREALNGGRG